MNMLPSYVNSCAFILLADTEEPIRPPSRAATVEMNGKYEVHKNY